MAERSGSSPLLAFLVGGLIVAVAVIGYFVWSGRTPAPPQMPAAVDLDVTVPEAPRLPDAPTLPAAPVPTPK